jgi:hypothetical protein
VREAVLPQIQVGGQPVPVRFNVQQGVVTLTGTVPNVAQRDQIANLVQQVPGVTQVNNQMLVGTATTGIVTTAPSASPAATAPNQTGTATTSGSVITPNTLTPTGRTNQAQP